MSSFATRWSVSQLHEVAPGDLDADGSITDEAVGRWIASARSAYLAECTNLERIRDRSGLVLRDRGGPHPGGGALGSPTAVVVTASATEVLPRAFVVAVRLRPGGGDRDTPVNARCLVQLEDPATDEAREITDEIRDELIALEHAASHFN